MGGGIPSEPSILRRLPDGVHQHRHRRGHPDPVAATHPADDGRGALTLPLTRRFAPPFPRERAADCESLLPWEKVPEGRMRGADELKKIRRPALRATLSQGRGL